MSFLATDPARGEVWTVDLNPVVGREQGGTRPALILSDDGLNSSPRDLVIVVPITGTDRKFPTHVPISPPEAGLTKVSQAMVEQCRSISKGRLVRRIGRASPETMEQVSQTAKFVLGL